MQKTAIVYLLLFISYLSFSQQKRDYKVYQFVENDSLHGHICKIVKFNEKGLKSFEEIIDYKSSSVDGTSDYVENDFYQDTLLVKVEETYRNSENKRITDYKYNSNNQLIEKEFRGFEKRLKKRSGKNQTCIITEKDYEKNPTWEIESQIFYKYNSKNQQIEYYAPKYHWDSQNRYTYEYDENGKLSKETSLNHEEIIWEKKFENRVNGYDYIMSWRNEFKIESRKDWPYYYEVRFYRDSNNNIIKQTETDKNGNLEFEIRKFYNNQNQIIKEERFNGDGKLEITHKYIYE